MSELIDQATIDDLRINVDEPSMPDMCTITTITYVDDGGGGQTEVTTTVTTKCTLVPRGGREVVSGDQLREQGDYRLFVPIAVLVPNNARVTHESGKVYQVVYTPPLTGHSTSLEVGLRDA